MFSLEVDDIGPAVESVEVKLPESRGTFALYSLIRNANVGFIPSRQVEDGGVSNIHRELPSNFRLRMVSRLKSKLENSFVAKLFATLLGTSMVIGNEILTPCISVLLTVEEIREVASSITQDVIVWISVAILVGLFMVQRFGTDKVGHLFAPVITIWFLCNGSIGFYNLVKFDTSVVKAVNPGYILYYFQRNGKEAWLSLGGIVLSITGTEALFADLGHFSVPSIRLSMCAVAYPALVLAYSGQGAFLREYTEAVSRCLFSDHYQVICTSQCSYWSY